MNERIRKLALQANPASKEIYESDNWEYNCAAWCAQDLEKFAELIVQECAKFLAENSGYDNSNNAWHPEPEDLLQHFGVEE